MLRDIDFDYLQLWGHYRTLVALHGRIHRRITDPTLNTAHLTNLGLCHDSLGDYRQAIDLHTQALAIARDTGNRRVEGSALGNLGNCHESLGDYRQAIDLHTQALAIARDTGDRQGEANALGNLGNCHYRLGDYRQAIDLHTQAPGHRPRHRQPPGRGRRAGQPGELPRQPGRLPAGHRPAHPGPGHRPRHRRPLRRGQRVGYLGRAWLASGNPRQAAALLGEAVSIADTTGDMEPAVEARSWLARAYLQLGDPAAALAATTARRDLPYPSEEPAMRLLEGLALLELDRRQESVRAFNEAVTAADTLLALADRNVAALQARALALTGLAVVAGDLARAAEAGEALGAAEAPTGAAGVAADTRRMLDQLARHDQSGILAKARAAKGP